MNKAIKLQTVVGGKLKYLIKMTTQVLSQYITAQLAYLSIAIKLHAKPFLDGRNLTKLYTPELSK